MNLCPKCHKEGRISAYLVKNEAGEDVLQTYFLCQYCDYEEILEEVKVDKKQINRESLG